MTLSDFASIATVISGVAVLGSLIYLGLQTRQNTKHIRALLWQGAADRGVSLNLALADRDLVMAHIIANGEEPTSEAVVKRQFHLQCIAHYIQYEDLFAHRDENLLSEEVFQHFQAAMVAMLADNPGMRSFFASRAAMSDTRFDVLLRQLVSEADARRTPD
ncbi:MAG TPA: hypothetical protein VH000_02005 [Rhizomicrobium sp.]|jgi:hypothetical protein|nr:hypothetical protein [Rhizomicrobium sp.]